MGHSILDKMFHWPFYDEKKSRSRCKMPGCIFFTHVFCTKCEIHLCLTSKRNCFYSMHNGRMNTDEQRRRCCNDDLVDNSNSGDNDCSSSFSKESSSSALIVNLNERKRKCSFDSEKSVNENDACIESNGSNLTTAKHTKHNSFIQTSFEGVFAANKW